MRIPTGLQGIRDPTPFLQIFSHKFRTGFLAVNHNPINKRSVEQCIRSVGQIFAAVGAPDPRLNTMGAIIFLLGQQFATYAKQYPPPVIVRPFPVSILHYMDAFSQGGSPRRIAIADLVWIAFFFLLRPGEYYTGRTGTLSTFFSLCDIQFFVVTPTHPIQQSFPFHLRQCHLC